jgi:hypothetical protein
LGFGIDKVRPDYTVVTGEWEVGRIYQTRGGPDNLRWFWSMTANGPMTLRWSSQCMELLTAMVAFVAFAAQYGLPESWRSWLAQEPLKRHVLVPG